MTTGMKSWHESMQWAAPDAFLLVDAATLASSIVRPRTLWLVVRGAFVVETEGEKAARQPPPCRC